MKNRKEKNEMIFNYNTLKQAAKEGSRLGRWKELPVFSCSKQGLLQKGNGAYYVVYDDDNAFVKKTADTWFRYGYLDQSGSVHEENSRSYFPVPKPQVKSASTSQPSMFTYASGTFKEEKKPEYKREETTADVRIGVDVEETLRRAREMTVADLLEGFNYGL